MRGWPEITLGEVCEFKRGLTYSKKDEVELSSNAIFRANNIDLSNNKIVLDEIRYISDAIQVSTDKKIKRDDILICTASGSKSHLGKVAIAGSDIDMAFGGFMGVIRSKPQIFPRYLFNVLISPNFKNHLMALSAGANINNLTFKQIQNFKFQLPPIAVQKAIVTKLDATFASIDTAIAAAEKNAENAKQLFQSYLNDVFEKGGEGWLKVTLQEMLDKRWIVSHLDGNHGSDYPRKEEFVSSGVRYISANCLDGDVLDITQCKYLSKARASKLRKGLAQNNDVLFAHNATVGPVAILHTDDEYVILGTSLTYYRCNREFIEPLFLANYMRSDKFKNQYLSIMRQSTRNQIPITKQREFFHVIPPITVQQQLLPTFDGIMAMTTQYEKLVLEKRSKLSELKHSLLQQAFSGQLADT